MNRYFMSPGAGSPTPIRKYVVPIDSSVYTMVQSRSVYSLIKSDQINKSRSPIQSQVKLFTQVQGGSRSPKVLQAHNNYSDDQNGYLTHRNTYMQISPKDTNFSTKSQLYDTKIKQLSSTTQPHKKVKNNINNIKQTTSTDKSRELLIQLTQEVQIYEQSQIDELRRIIRNHEIKQVVLDSMQQVNTYVAQKFKENESQKIQINDFNQKIKSMAQQYDQNIELLNIKFESILIENMKLKNQLEQTKSDQGEEQDYFKQKQQKFINEYHEMNKIKKDLDDEVISASQENYKKIIDIKNHEIDNLVQHIENTRFYFNDSQKFQRESDYQQNMRRMTNVNLETEKDGDIALMKREIQNLKYENELEGKIKMNMRECNQNHETNDFENIHDEQFEKLMKSKLNQKNSYQYLEQQMINLREEENEQQNQEIQNLHQLLNQRNVEFQFVQQSISNDKEELIRVNSQLKEQLQLYQQDYMNKIEVNQSDLVKEIQKLQQKLENKIKDNEALKDVLGYFQREQIEERQNKSQFGADLILSRELDDSEINQKTSYFVD